MIANPGSIEAQDKGCQCPVIDNHYGKGMPHPDGLTFWISKDCNLHNTLLTDPACPGCGSKDIKKVKKVAAKKDKKTKKDSKRTAGY